MTFCGASSRTSIAVFAAPFSAHAQASVTRTDSVAMSRDLDGNGKTDWVVLESKPGRFPEMRAHRIAVYLNASPTTRKPGWATEWDDVGERVVSFGGAKPLGRDGSLIEIDESGGDADIADLLLASAGHVRRDIYFQSNYGDGYLTIVQRDRRTIVVASLDNVELRGRGVPSKLKCEVTKLAVVDLIYEPRRGHFTVGRIYCLHKRPVK